MISLEDILSVYGSTLHPPLVLILCISGSLGHLLCIATLSRMLNPTNMLLISMSFFQLALCVNFLYATLFKWASDELCSPLFYSYPMAVTMFASVQLSLLVHISGVFHVVALSVVRYACLVRLSGVNSSLPWFTFGKCRTTLLIIYISVFLIGIPLYFTSEIVEVPEKEGCVDRYYELSNVSSYELSLTPNKALQTANFCLYNLAAKLFPSVILCVMTLLIRRELKSIRSISARFSTLERDRQYQRTTNMILAIMIMFIVVELPQGILAVLSTFTPISILHSLGDLTEMLTLLTSCLIFALFCAMNSRIRKALSSSFVFRSVIRPSYLHKKNKGSSTTIGEKLLNGSEKQKQKFVLQ